MDETVVLVIGTFVCMLTIGVVVLKACVKKPD